MTKPDYRFPPPELLLQLEAAWFKGNVNVGDLLTTAYQSGADQELEACLEWLVQEGYIDAPCRLRTARRPKPPSLKEQAFAVLDDCSDRLDSAHENTIRRALEALDD